MGEDETVHTGLMSCVPESHLIHMRPHEVANPAMLVGRYKALWEQFKHTKPFIVICDAGPLYNAACRELALAHIPVYRAADRAAVALASIVRVSKLMTMKK
eukprot:NODE_2103_length_509_cov_1164.889130_g1719_i0.p2 GENE.NODE_2103_length_509_cov_1164.889130_g1719_i0~~NODE_2103_length_509_cov_1164.889130_g1719_i0.p2  ORF type:complete len:101 (-),score=18.33 NODE_2103_length_509_cov_1164.889130_g1719_i0:175-477(-)